MPSSCHFGLNSNISMSNQPSPATPSAAVLLPPATCVSLPWQTLSIAVIIILVDLCLLGHNFIFHLPLYFLAESRDQNIQIF
jgi:hypothetical protein